MNYLSRRKSKVAASLTRTFSFLKGIGVKKEEQIRSEAGDWDGFLKKERIKGVSGKRKKELDQELKEAIEQLSSGNWYYFKERLPRSEHWLLIDLHATIFDQKILFLDIETGLSRNDIILLGAVDYENNNYQPFVKGRNLSGNNISSLLEHFDIIVTFNGLSFDIPILKRFFNIDEEFFKKKLLIDLRHLLRKIGFTGGLKSIEQDCGIRRSKEVIGFDASRAYDLWVQFRMTNDPSVLDQLIAYNEADCKNMIPLLEQAIGELREKIMKNKG